MRKNISLTSKEFNRIIEKNVKPTIVSYFKSREFYINEYTVEEVVCMFNEKLAKSIDKYDETKSQGAWFSTIALHSAYDYITDEYRWNKHNQSMSIVDKDGDYSDMDCLNATDAMGRTMEVKDIDLYNPEKLKV